MTDRYRPNEPSCPVPLELLTLLLRSPPGRAVALANQMPEADRAKLAVYLAGRAHMRQLGYLVLRECSEGAVRRAAGNVGSLLRMQAMESPVPQDEIRAGRRPVSLARVG